MQGAEAVALERAQQGSETAFQALVEEHSHPLFRLAFRMTGNEQDAEDVVQEAFLRAYRRLDDYQSSSHFAAWLHRSAANYAIDLLRRRKRWRVADLETLETHAPLTSEQPGPERVAFGAEIRDNVERQLAALSAKERMAFTLRHHEGLSLKEIGQIMDSSVGAIKNHLFRAVRKLRRALEPVKGETP
jgi:RNA polymerase sigma-70 factor (ECF subfamily)